MSTGGRNVRELTALLSALRRACLQHPIHATQLHANLLVSAGARPHPHPVLLTQLVSLYADAGRLIDALRAFRAHLPSANLHTYAVLVSALARPRPDLAFSLFSGSRRQFRPSPHVISAVLSAYAVLQPLCERGFDAGTRIPTWIKFPSEDGDGEEVLPMSLHGDGDGENCPHGNGDEAVTTDEEFSVDISTLGLGVVGPFDEARGERASPLAAALETARWRLD